MSRPQDGSHSSHQESASVTGKGQAHSDSAECVQSGIHFSSALPCGCCCVMCCLTCKPMVAVVRSAVGCSAIVDSVAVVAIGPVCVPLRAKGGRAVHVRVRPVGLLPACTDSRIPISQIHIQKRRPASELKGKVAVPFVVSIHQQHPNTLPLGKIPSDALTDDSSDQP